MDYNLGPDGDDLYRELLDLFQGLEPDQHTALMAQLILAMMNEVGDANRIRQIFTALGGNKPTMERNTHRNFTH